MESSFMGQKFTKKTLADDHIPYASIQAGICWQKKVNNTK